MWWSVVFSLRDSVGSQDELNCYKAQGILTTSGGKETEGMVVRGRERFRWLCLPRPCYKLGKDKNNIIKVIRSCFEGMIQDIKGRDMT